MFGKSITLFSLFGFKVKVDITWAFLALLVAWSLAQGLFPTLYEGLPTVVYWWMGVAGVIGLFFSIVFHELSHSLVARYYGLPMGSITLFIFGGVAEMEEEPASPKVEALMAIAGPIASVVLGAAFYGLALAGEAAGMSAPAVAVISYLGFLNVLLAVFNMIPAFPLDGGRVLRAVLWHMKGSIRRATRISSRIGAGFGIALIVLGVISALTGNFVGGMWWVLIGLFVRGAAAGSYHQLMTRRALEGEPVRRFMTATPVTVSPRVTVQELVEDYVYKHYFDMFPIVEDGQLTGCVSTRQVKEIARDRWPLLTVGEVASTCSEENTVPADLDAAKALSQMQRTGNSRLMVVENGQLVGIVALRDLLKLLSLKMDLEGED